MLKPFAHAISGIWSALRSERNMKIHVVAMIVVLLLGWYLDIERSDWLILCILFGLVISAELMNTAVEKLCDLVQPEKDERVKFIKDVAAGSVFVASLIALITGVILFYPYFTTLFAQ